MSDSEESEQDQPGRWPSIAKALESPQAVPLQEYYDTWLFFFYEWTDADDYLTKIGYPPHVDGKLVPLKERIKHAIRDARSRG